LIGVNSLILSFGIRTGVLNGSVFDVSAAKLKIKELTPDLGEE
jgi:hypothetical protein